MLYIKILVLLSRHAFPKTIRDQSAEFLGRRYSKLGSQIAGMILILDCRFFRRKDLNMMIHIVIVF